MPVAKKYMLDPELTGEYAFQASSAAQERENVDRTNAARFDQAQLAQQGAIAAGQMQQHALDRAAASDSRAMNAAIDADANRMRLQANTDDNRTQETLKKLEGQQAAQTFQNQVALKQLGSDLEQRNKLADDLNVPNFLAGPMQEHGLAVGNQKLIDAANESHNDELIAKASAGSRPAMQQALAQGLFRYSPQQQQRLQELQGALGKLNDPRFAAQDRVNGQIQIMQEMNSIQPQLVPKSERMPDMNDRINQAMGVGTNPITGKPFVGTFDRSGVMEVVDFTPNEPKDKPKTFAEAYQGDPKFTLDVRKQAFDRAMEIAKTNHAAKVSAATASGRGSVPDFTGPTAQEIAAQEALLHGNQPTNAPASVPTGDQTTNVDPAASGESPVGGGGALQQQPAAPSGPAPSFQAPPAKAQVSLGGQTVPALGMLTMPGGEQVPMATVNIGGKNLAAAVKGGVATLMAYDEQGKPVPVAQFDGSPDAGTRRNPIKATPENVAKLGRILPIGTFIIVGNQLLENKK